MDVQRSTHAVQITEYQEQVIDLELFNQDLATEIDQLTERLTGREKEHVHAIDELRSRLDAASQRADREIGEVKEMHATKCNELAAQVSMLLSKCQRYRQRLVDVGVSEDELLQLGTQEREESSKSQRVSSAEQLQIADLAFIEKQYIETRESSQEADYFKQLMDIERSMENTTMALGFELKRTQAKYLEQAADFIRDQMARLQVETTRSESRLTRALSLRAPGKNAAGLVADLMQQEQRPPLPPMATVVANNAQSNTAAGHRRIAGPDPGNSNDAGAEIAEIVSVSREDLEAASAAASEQVAAAALRRGRQASPVAVEPAQRTEENAHDLLASADRLPVMSRQRSSSMAAYPEHHQVQQRWATVSNALGIRRSQHTGNLAVDGSTGAVARGFQSESRTSGLSRMINAAAARSSSSSGGPSRLAEQQPAPMAVGSDVEGNELQRQYSAPPAAQIAVV
ncbi:hypothetical protein LPJ81_005851 [Coemansia sp. IMI 209127]|nr:hypothetical protein LPJ81_005851 [Coemansia sp. IMI 209127]